MFPDLLVIILVLLLFVGWILHSGVFGLFNDTAVSRRRFALLFIGKSLAVPVFLFIYSKIYGGIENFDTGKFYHDVKEISDYGKQDLNFLLRFLLGLQNDAKGSVDYENVLKNTLNWDNGTVKDYLYNDNRIVIRFHVLLDLIPFMNYPAHALMNCFLSFTGILFLYKTFKEWFVGKELWLLLILCFFPALWFYTGAVLKEGLTFFVLGCTLYHLRRCINRDYTVRRILYLSIFLFLSVLLKPYLLIYAAMVFGLFFVIAGSEKVKNKFLIFVSAIALGVVVVNGVSVLVKQRSLLEAALKHQHRFIGVSKGGIFLTDSKVFIRLTNDTTQLKSVEGRKETFTIRPGVSYMYWKTVDQKDTLYCFRNEDTLKEYALAYVIQPGMSNIKLPDSNGLHILAGCLYYTLLYPSFFNARNALQLLASFENLAIVIALLIVSFGFIKAKKNTFLPAVFVFFALTFCVLIGLTAPNSGAIFRYRTPAIIFLFLAALYFVDFTKKAGKSDRTQNLPNL